MVNIFLFNRYYLINELDNLFSISFFGEIVGHVIIFNYFIFLFNLALLIDAPAENVY